MMQGYLIYENPVTEKLVECSFDLLIVLAIGFFAGAITRAICRLLLNKERINSDDYEKYLNTDVDGKHPKGGGGVEA